MIVIHSLIRCPTVSQFMSQGFTPAHALLDLLLELLSWPCMPNYDIVRIAVTTLSLFRFPFPFSVSTFRFHFPFPPFTVALNNGLENSYQPIPRFVCNIEALIPQAFPSVFVLLYCIQTPQELVDNYYHSVAKKGPLWIVRHCPV